MQKELKALATMYTEMAKLDAKSRALAVKAEKAFNGLKNKVAKAGGATPSNYGGFDWNDDTTLTEEVYNDLHESLENMSAPEVGYTEWADEAKEFLKLAKDLPGKLVKAEKEAKAQKEREKKEKAEEKARAKAEAKAAKLAQKPEETTEAA